MTLEYEIKQIAEIRDHKFPDLSDIPELAGLNDADCSIEVLAEFLDVVLQSPKGENGKIKYACGVISLVPEQKIEALLSRLAPASIERLVFEKRYLKKRSVQMVLDFAFRFRGPVPGKYERMLSTLHRCAKEHFPSAAERFAPSLLFLANGQTDQEPEKRVALLERYFPAFRADHLNRVFDKFCNPLNQNWLKEHLPRCVTDVDVPDRALLNAFLLSSSYAPELTKALRDKIIQRRRNMSSDAPLYDDFCIMAGEIADGFWEACPRIKPRSYSADRKKLRVAFLLSGQMRGFEEAFASWGESLRLDMIEPVFFVHSWTDVGRKQLTGHHAYRHFKEPLASEFQRICNELGGHKLRYPKLDRLFNESATTNVTAVWEAYNPKAVWLDDDNLLGDDATNQQKMFYKIKGAHSLASLANQEFDLVVRVRPDKKFLPHGKHFDWQDIYHACWQGVVFSDFEPSIRLHQGVATGDQLLISSPAGADVISSAWDVVPILEERNSEYFPTGYRPHSTIATLALAQGLQIKRMPGLVLSDKYLCDVSPVPMALVKQALEDDAKDRQDHYDQRLQKALGAVK